MCFLYFFVIYCSLILFCYNINDFLNPCENFIIDKYALLSFKNSISSDLLSMNWSDNTSFCNWIGVSCGLKHSRVTALDLSGCDLAGTVAPHLGNLTFLRYLDISINNFTGILPFELSNLHRLKVMNVGSNSFTGDIPTWLGSLAQVEKLYLYNNSFSGTIPVSLFNNSKLQILHMSFNSVGGNIPKEIASSSLREVRIRNNRLNGSIPHQVGNISSLQLLDLNYNQLSGLIPHGIFNLSSMREIKIMYNSISGSLPTDMCNNIPNLKTFFISSNQLSGEIPSSIWKCRGLEILSIRDNHLQGGIPPEIGSLTRLEKLSITDNNLSGRIPREIGNLSMIRELYLHNNHLQGELPQEIGSLPILQHFTVFSNYLYGSIPSSIFNLSTLKTLALSSNEFSGTLPSDMGCSITNASQLIYLEISANSLSGRIPNFGKLRHLQRLFIWGNNLSEVEAPTQELTFLSSLTNCQYLKYLDISDNPLNGILPTSIGNFSTSLEFFSADNNNIMGNIPYEIGNLGSLLSLSLARNQLSGPIPSSISELKKLQRIYIGGNQLVGTIPTQLCGMNNLGVLNIDDNMLVGPIPECLGEVKSLREIDLSSNQLKSTIPPNFWTLKDLTVLNLSKNNFIGQLSYQLGNLKTVFSLDLSFNQFSSDIPSIIDGCQSLEILNLSHNKFTGSPPNSLGNLRGLITLDLSYNNLSGSIPNSLEDLPFLNKGHSQSSAAKIFAHNFALCGSTRFQVQPCPRKNDGRSQENEIGRLIMCMLPSLILPVIVVIVLFVFIRRQKREKVALCVVMSPLMIEWRRFSYTEIERTTGKFSETNLLGKGGYGSVFEATLSDGLKVAVKVFNMQLQGATRSFRTETAIMSTIRHRNLVQLIGWCGYTEFKALIMSYMPNGSLDKWLCSDMGVLDLIQRLKIAIDVAAALEYLHHGYTFPVVHCDIKPNNVLLDEDMVAHVSDFGIAKLFQGGEAVAQTQTLATIGYAAPELGMEGKVSTKGDVYSFGIMLLEMFTGKKPTDDMFSGEMSLKEWVFEALQHNATTKIVPSVVLSREDQHFSAKEQCVSSIFELAMKCLAFRPHERINMIEVAATLWKINARIVAAIQRCRPRYAHYVSIRDDGF